MQEEMNKTDFNEPLAGDLVYGTTKIGTIFSGKLIMTMDVDTGNTKERLYKICIQGDNCIVLKESDINCIEKIVPHSTKEYLKENIEDKLGVKCFNEDGDRYDTSIILAKMLDDEQVWDNLTEEEKREFVANVSFSLGDIVEVVNCYCDEREAHNRTHNKNMEVLGAAIKCMKQFKNIKKAVPGFESVYDYLFKLFGVEDLIETIAKVKL